MKKYLPIIILVLSISLVLSACGQTGEAAEPTQVVDTPVTSSGVIAEGVLVPREYAHLAFQSAGEVVEILVEEGDQVTTDQPLARLGNREALLAQLATAELELTSAQQALDDLLENAAIRASQVLQELLNANQAVLDAQAAVDEIDEDEYEEQLDDAQIAVNEAKDDLEDAQEEFDENADLAEDNTVRQQSEDDLEEAQKDYNEAVRERDQIELDYRSLHANLRMAEEAQADASREYEAWQNGPDPDQLTLAESRLANAQAQVDAVHAALDNLEITAPFEGTIVDIDIALNEQAVPGQPVILLADFSEWYVETDDLTEIEVVKIEEGQTVELEADALPGETLEGTVERIKDFSELRRGDVTYTARILLDEFDLPLRWGMTMIVRFPEAE